MTGQLKNYSKYTYRGAFDLSLKNSCWLYSKVDNMDVSPRPDMFLVAWSPRCTVDICLQILPSLAVILSIYFHRNFAVI